MTDPDSGLSADSLSANGDRSFQTSRRTSAYMWSTLVARELGIVSRGEALRRLMTTVGTLEDMERHVSSGQF